jgi:GNAT superfamily N-acetyltransferase
MTAATSPDLEISPATPERWEDLEALFGRNGACAGCWCQFWRQSQAEYRAGKGAANRRALRRQVLDGEVPGLLAYADGEAVGWVALAPRAAYARLGKARNLVAVDDAPVWSAPCFFVKRGWRGRGLAGLLLQAAAERARQAGAPFLEGYPVDSRAELGDAFVYTGAYSTFVRLGFAEVARRARTRPVMRLSFPTTPSPRVMGRPSPRVMGRAEASRGRKGSRRGARGGRPRARRREARR